MVETQENGRRLEPLAYHVGVVDYLKRHEPDVWAWASSQRARDEHLQKARDSLLRDTYRLEAGAHTGIHAELQQAMQRLGIHAPATLYQAGSAQMNAALMFMPGEVHIVLEGPILERLSDTERLALFGHELAHYLLWSRDDGNFLVADRILNDALGSSQASASHHETFRRYALHTELFADRGGAIASDALEPAVNLLIKTQTGITDPDPMAYLRQATEIDARDTGASGGSTHPETFLRARALDLWWRHADELEDWLERRLCGALALPSLDLAGQSRLQAMTRGFLAFFLGDTTLRSDPVIHQVRELFPDWSADETAVPPSAFAAPGVDASVREYLNALMLDMALADDDVQDAALRRAVRTAHELGSLDPMLAALRRDARLGKREIDKLKKAAAVQA